jgi:DHA1 family inner membrane transport protein
VQRLEWKLMFAVTAATGVGYLSADAMPMWLGAVMESLALGPEQAGRVGSAELLAGAVASLFIAPLAARIPRRRIALIACACVAAGYAFSAYASSYVALGLFRVATGFSFGIVVAAGNAAAAGARDPDRIFAGVAFFAGLAASVVLVLVGYMAESQGPTGIFLLLAGIVLIAMPVLLWLPASVAEQEVMPSATTRLSLMPLATLAALFLLSVSGQGLWAFTERIGSAIGLGTERIGWWISLANLAGLASAALATWMGTRVGRTVPIALAITLSGSAQWTLVNASSETVYVVAQTAWALAFFFWAPFVMGSTAELDRGGRWTVVAGAVTMLGVATGPWIAGQTLERWQNDGLSALLVGCAVTGLLLLLPVMIKLDRGAGHFAKSTPEAG